MPKALLRLSFARWPLRVARCFATSVATTTLVLSQCIATARADQAKEPSPTQSVIVDGTPAESAPGTATSAKPTAAEAIGETKPDETKLGDTKPEAKAAPDTKAEDKKKPTFAVVPGPFYNPSLGLGLNVIPMLMFHPRKSDQVSPPSIALINLLYAIKPPFEDAGSRQSFVGAAATRLYLDEDRWRVVGIAAYINLFQQFYGLGGDADVSNTQFDYRLEQIAAFGQVYRQVFWKGFYVGGLLGAIAYHTKTKNPEDEAVLDSIGSGADWRLSPNIGLLSQYDSRDNKYYPTQGINFNLRMNGSIFKDGQQYVLLAPGLNQYFSLLGGDRLVLAYRLFGQFGFGNLPISAYARYGMRGTTLGYETGEYMDKKMAGIETELRWMVWKRIGVEGGGGVGKVFAEFSDFPGATWLPGVWGSGTFKIMEKQDIRARATVAYGKSGVLFYFAVGQNF